MLPDRLILQVFRDPVSFLSRPLGDWDILLRQARSFNLLGRLASLFQQQSLLDRVPGQPREHLLWDLVRAERYVLAVRSEVDYIREALARVGIPLILLKGAAYALAGLPAAAGRYFSDIDILVPQESLNDVEAALLMHGWISSHHDEYDQHYYRTWMHELPPMQHVRRMTVIDVHHAIVPRTAPVHPSPQKLRAAAQALPNADNLFVLGPEDMVLHSAVHLFHDGEFDNGLRDLVDIDTLLRHFGAGQGFWESLTQRAVEMELSRPLFYALRYSSHILGTPVPKETLQSFCKAGPSGIFLAGMDALFQRGILGPSPWSPERHRSPAHFLLYVRANALRMPPMLLVRHLFYKAFISQSKEENAN